jgi:starch synthase (maltosyl-transferring)
MHQGKIRVVIENLQPQVDGGRFAAKRAIGATVAISADVFTDGHDAVSCALLYKPERAAEWNRVSMEPLGNDRWEAHFTAQLVGRYLYTVVGWVDAFETWQRDLAKKHAAKQDLEVDFMRGAELAIALSSRVPDIEAAPLQDWARSLVDKSLSVEERAALAQSEALRELAHRYPDPDLQAQYEPALPIKVDRERARYSTWYELFPRSAGANGKHGTLRDCEALLPDIAAMGFDVLYLPPIHPIGNAFRKGANNALNPKPSEPGSPWAIGNEAGGHKSIHPELGTLEDFHRLVNKAEAHHIEIALDIAFQASPDHPYVKEHPEWFLKRPDGTIQYAENPPKKYQDIYPFHFECEDWRALWNELKSVVEFWIAQGVRIFRVDNPHTKPFPFWEWLITEVHGTRPDIIFLAEAFTRPKVMHRLAKLGFTQSYTYFTWRNTKYELTEYLTQLNTAPVADFFRPNFWPNTPDILPEYLQFGGRNGFMVRLVLAATMSANYGIYGPAFELMEHEPREPGSEEYLDSEKYQLRQWNLRRADSLRDFIARVNRIRRDNPALQHDGNLEFHDIDNDSLIAYSKTADEGGDSVLVIVNLDPHHTQTGWLRLDLTPLGVPADNAFQAHDLLSGARFLWKGARNYVALDPAHTPAHLFRIRRKVRTERDFDYFL